MVAALVQRLPAFVAAEAGTQQDAVVAAWLHDVIEDTPITVGDLLNSGVRERAVDAVVALTRIDGVAPDDYYASIAMKPVSLLVKTADLGSNLAPERVGQLDAATRERLDRKYTHALEQLNVPRTTIDAVHH